MSNSTFAITLPAMQSPRRKLHTILKKTASLQPLYQQIGDYLLTVHRQRWQLQQSPEGQSWLPLSPDYQRSKPAASDLILVLNDHLRQSLSYWGDDQGLSFGTPLEYGAIHHYGGNTDMSPQNAAIPARPWLGVSDDDIEQINQILKQYLKEQ
ncbi:phage virion morphogenesis protein [Photobacterium sp.]|uniref:phage virion morphogenesis protein n=1 Tax=Photobacterium sp. TaxID=660 RepID=UPI00299EF8E9|nr:phage virion morphogenesis protein [Photobacterium sp.]MDX1301200.1 phage virion morphogenesis protein [Photobacterium sp.]